MIDAKELKKIVRVCQKNGIVRFKSGDFEIEIKQGSVERDRKAASGLGPPDSEPFPSWDSLTPEQKLLWSSTPDIPTS